ncbi:ATP-dependent helicase/nuclease subunit A [Paenibacillus sp. J31TS4]|uniref:helicase-exonuclease AddAB subunit AddA n=1 Tax=Paenibacillus sp. J31TS4 TaxID=2807195 RepID=UPI001B1F4864|nr:helicase-exonuclease AddAB subunit AddA [Paenibacillus sp. J31TS4]GIP39596.1 ATP-dependent helicase/nuclease subunit A [Paenibacillus sp. J31TS4]
MTEHDKKEPRPGPATRDADWAETGRGDGKEDQMVDVGETAAEIAGDIVREEAVRPAGDGAASVTRPVTSSAVPPKPAGAVWTDGQWEAIARRGSNILVAAAAGSGKTAVLVERIIRRVSDEREPVDVDRLLVATFTKAAASEMRERIREALEKALYAKPDSAHLRRQLALLGRASITTLHSFCLEVIQRYYQMIRLDPGFRIANETETDMLRQDVLEELFEEYYTNADAASPFWTLLEWFGGERSDEALFRLVLRLHDASQSHPDPAGWLQEMAGLFDPEGERPSLWFETLQRDVRLELEGMLGLLAEASRLAGLPGGPAPYLVNLTEEKAALAELLQLSEGEWEALYAAFQTAPFGRLKPCKGDDLDPALQQQTKELREIAKTRFAKLKSELFGRTPEEYRRELGVMRPLMEMLTELTLAFGDRFQKGKAGKGLIDFGDLEHYCLAILADPASPPGELRPSLAAQDYRNQFVEILLDEYQDTNLVQEAIVSLISRDGAGNRFMVGDVKQSIYRFRLAEPGLFLAKYKSFGSDGSGDGVRIDLSSNFRSRREVVDGVNFLFKRFMKETVGEVAYDRDAELVYGASYYEQAAAGRELPVEWMLIDRSRTGLDETEGPDEPAGEAADGEGPEAEAGLPDPEEERQEWETAQLEARSIGLQIRRLLGADGGKPFQVYDKREKGLRDATYRDIVILLRATQSWAPVFMEELRLLGIPAYADLNTGYFSATEVDIVLSLLKVIDNPYQDIPLAGVLRSPILGLSADELAAIRLKDRKGSYYAALLAFAEEEGGREELRGRIVRFLRQLEGWRTDARQGSLTDLIRTLYRETGFYEFVGGMPGGIQRQANLRALQDRARQYEATSFRGLFRFLRFVERMQESGGDLGTARALGEQEDVVRIMSIHKSKGLEFPVVFVAGLGKGFNRMDLQAAFLLHKELGFGPRYVDLEQRVSYPSLPTLAIRRRMKLELLAEEMRILYVALTRAREKLFLLGTVKSLDKQLAAWSRTAAAGESGELADADVAQAKSYLDWVGPSLLMHGASRQQLEAMGREEAEGVKTLEDPSLWKLHVLTSGMLLEEAAAAHDALAGQEEKLDAVRQLKPVASPLTEEGREVMRRLGWAYRWPAASRMPTKTSVTEMKRRRDAEELLQGGPLTEPEEASHFAPPAEPRPTGVYRRPRFREDKRLNAAERGTAYHAVMQRMPLREGLTREDVGRTIADMVGHRLLTQEQADAVDADVVWTFFETLVGRRLLRAPRVLREQPFNYGLPAREVFGSGGVPKPAGEEPDSGARRNEETLHAGLDDGQQDGGEETILIQGVIDCLFEDEEGLVLLDFKTDARRGRTPEEMAARYAIQLELYGRAIENSLKKPLTEAYLYFFDGAALVSGTDIRKPEEE